MYQRRLCLGLNRQFIGSYEQQLNVFQEVGFEGFFANWEPGVRICDLRAQGDRLGLLFQSVHAPFEKMAAMWTPGEETEAAVGELTACLRDCADNEVPIMVAHAFIGFEDHNPTPFGIDNFGRVVREAERLGVKIAFENTEGEEYLAALMSAFRDSVAVGFCWDTGHEQCYNYGRDMTALYGDRLICTHLNDNLGIRDFYGRIFWHDDLHLLPFDGITDWQSVAARLKKWNFNGPLTFELNTRSKPGRRDNFPYERMDLLEYITAAYNRACRVAALMR